MIMSDEVQHQQMNRARSNVYQVFDYEQIDYMLTITNTEATK